MTLIRWLLKIPMMLGNILLYFLSIIFILTGVLSYDLHWNLQENVGE